MEEVLDHTTNSEVNQVSKLPSQQQTHQQQEKLEGSPEQCGGKFKICASMSMVTHVTKLYKQLSDKDDKYTVMALIMREL